MLNQDRYHLRVFLSRNLARRMANSSVFSLDTQVTTRKKFDSAKHELGNKRTDSSSQSLRTKDLSSVMAESGVNWAMLSLTIM